jgi:hypothetical protein
MASKLRQSYFKQAAAHCELTRSLAEHGVFGLVAITYLVISVARQVLRIHSSQIKLVVSSLAAFGILFMASNAMRIVLCSFVLGITFAVFTDASTRHFTRRKLPLGFRSRVTQPV